MEIPSQKQNTASPKSFRRWIASWFLALTLFSPVGFAGVATVVTIGVTAAKPANAQLAVVADVEAVLEWILNLIKNGLISAGKVAIKNYLKSFLEKLAYDSAVWIASGGEGQAPLVFTKDVGTFISEAGDAAVGEFLNTIAQENGLVEFDLCNLPTPEASLSFQLQLGTAVAPSPSGPGSARCKLSDIQKSFQETGATLQQQAAAFVQDPNAFVNFTTSLQPGGNYASSIGVATNIAIENEATAEATAELKRLKSDFDDKAAKVSGYIQTPSSLVKNQLEASLNQATGGELTQVNDVIADAAGIFLDTLSAKLMDRVSSGLLSFFTDSDISESLSGGSSTSGRSAGIAGASEKYANFVTPSFASSGEIDILNYFANCPDEGADVINCVVDEKFRRAIADGVSVRTLADNYVGQDFPFAFDANGAEIADPSQGISLRNIKILKQYNAVPVGWVLAAEYNRDFDGSALTLGALIDQFDDCGDDANTYSPYCGLVDPDWTLKVPDVFCKAQGFGQTIATSSFIDLDGNAYTPDEQLVSRLSSCLDSQSCLSEDDNGACEAYGYCTKQKRIYRFEGDSCPSYQASCELFETSDGNQLAYLKNTLNYNDCSSESVGCRWYSTLYNESAAAFQSADQTHIYPTCTTSGGCACSVDSDGSGAASDDETCTITEGSFSCLTGVGETCTLEPVEDLEASIAFDDDVLTCDEENAGCTEFVPVQGENNLLFNGGFEEFNEFHDSTDAEALDSLVDVVDPEAADGSLGAYDDTFGFYGEDGSGVDGSAGEPCVAAADSTHPCYGWEFLGAAEARGVFTAKTGNVAAQLNGESGGYMSAAVDTGHPLSNRTVVLGYSYLNPATEDCSGEVWIRPDDGSTTPEAETVTYFTSVDATTFNTFITNAVTFGADVSTSTVRIGITSPAGCNLAIDSAILQENSESTGFAEYGTTPLYLNVNKTTQCAIDDIGCSLFTPQSGENENVIPGQITNPLSEACSSGTDYSLATCSQCIADYVGCDSYIEEPTPYNAPVRDVAGFAGYNTADFDSANPGLAAATAARTGYYCDGTATSCSPERAELDCGAGTLCLPTVSIVPTTGQTCSSQDVGCEEYVNLDKQTQGGESLEYYKYIKQCVKPTEAQERDGELDTYYTFEGSDISGVQLRTWELKKSNIDNGPCTNLDFYGSTAETPEANCIDAADTQQACTATDIGVNPDCTEYYDSSGGIYYLLKSATITVTEECVGLRNSLDSRVYYSTPSESLTCSAASNQCREYRGSEGQGAQAIISETFDEGIWGGGESSSTVVSASGGQSMAIGDGTASGSTEADTTIVDELSSTNAYVASFWAKTTDTGTNTLRPFLAVPQGEVDTFAGTPYLFTDITNATISSAPESTIYLWDYGSDYQGAGRSTSGQINTGSTTFQDSDSGNPTDEQPIVLGVPKAYWNGLPTTHNITITNQDGEPVTYSLPALNEDAVESDTDIVFYGDIDGNLYWVDSGHNGTKTDLSDLLTPEQAMVVEHLATGTAEPDIETMYTKYYFSAATGNATTDATVAGVQLGTEWQQYTVGPFTFPEEVSSYVLFGFSFAGASGTVAYIDTVELRVNSSYYLIHNSATLCPGYEGCEEYIDDDGDTEYIKSFTKICEEGAVGCEAVFDTHNSASPFYEEFNTGNEFSQDDEFVPVDSAAAYVVKDEALCTSDVTGCSLFGKPDIASDGTVETFESVYVIDDPDTYGTALCQQQQLQCSEFADSTGAPAYFKDPGDKTCSYDSGSGTWKKADGSECPVQNENAPPSQPKGPICNGGLRTGQLCSLDSDCPDADGATIHRCVSDQDDSGWVGLCEENFTGCTLYVDPNTDSLIDNGTFETDVRNNDDITDASPDAVPDQWVETLPQTIGQGNNYLDAIAATMGTPANVCGFDGTGFNLVTNPVFEGDSALSLKSNYYEDGSTLNQICMVGPDSATIVDANTAYTLSGEVSIQNTTSPFAIGLLYYDSNGDPLDTGGDGNPDNDDPESYAIAAFEGAGRSDTDFSGLVGQWMRFHATIGPNQERVFPTGTYSVKVFVEALQDDTAVYFDNITFSQNDEYTYINNTVDGSGVSDNTSCTAVDVNGGCVAFRDVTNDDLTTLGDIQTQINANTAFTVNTCAYNSGVETSTCNSLPNTADSNVILKVRNDRECAEWLSCSSARTLYDDEGNATNTTCFEVGTCVQRNEDTGVCTQWAQKLTADNLDANSDLAVVSEAGNTEELGEIKDLSGYSYVGAQWGGKCDTAAFGVRGGGATGVCTLGKKGESCSSDADCTAITYGFYPVEWMPQVGLGAASTTDEIVVGGDFERVTCSGESEYDFSSVGFTEGDKAAVERGRRLALPCTVDAQCRTNDTEAKLKEILQTNNRNDNLSSITYSDGWCANVSTATQTWGVDTEHEWDATGSTSMTIIDYDPSLTYTTTGDLNVDNSNDYGAALLNLNNVLYVDMNDTGAVTVALGDAIVPDQEYTVSFDAQFLSGDPAASKLGVAFAHTTNTFEDGVYGIDVFTDDIDFEATLQRYTLGPITVTGKNAPTDKTYLYFAPIGLVAAESNNDIFILDNVSLKPSLAVNAEQNPTDQSRPWLISRECRGYPEQSSVQCAYTKLNGSIYSGWKGYCLEHDEADNAKCIAWWPVDVLAAEPDTSSRQRVRYSEKYPAYHCLVAKGNEQFGACENNGVMCVTDDDCSIGVCIAGKDADEHSHNDYDIANTDSESVVETFSTNDYTYTHEIDNFYFDQNAENASTPDLEDNSNQDYARFAKISANAAEQHIHISEIENITFDQGDGVMRGFDDEDTAQSPLATGLTGFSFHDLDSETEDLWKVGKSDQVQAGDTDIAHNIYYSYQYGAWCGNEPCDADNLNTDTLGDADFIFEHAITPYDDAENIEKGSSYIFNGGSALNLFQSDSSKFGSSGSVWGCNGRIAGTNDDDYTDDNILDCNRDSEYGNSGDVQFNSNWSSEWTDETHAGGVNGGCGDNPCGSNIILSKLDFQDGYLQTIYYGIWNGTPDWDYTMMDNIRFTFDLKEPCLVAVEAADANAQATPWQTRIQESSQYTVLDLGYSHSMSTNGADYNDLFGTIGGDGIHNPADIDGLVHDFSSGFLDFTEIAERGGGEENTDSGYNNLPYVYVSKGEGTAVPYACIGKCNESICQDDYRDGPDGSQCTAGWIGVPGLCVNGDGSAAFADGTNERQFCDDSTDCASISVDTVCSTELDIDMELNNGGVSDSYDNYTEQLNAATQKAWERYRLLFADIGETLWYAPVDNNTNFKPYLVEGTANTFPSAFDENFDTMDVCSDSTRDDDEYCGIRPTATNIQIDNNESGDVTIANGASVALTLDVAADPDQEPVQTVSVVWEGHTDGSGFHEERAIPDAWEAASTAGLNYSHVYTCDPAGEYWNNTKRACQYEVKVQIMDNWNFCSGETHASGAEDNTRTNFGSCTSYDSYAGTIYVTP